jgi:hypothetical protein
VLTYGTFAIAIYLLRRYKNSVEEFQGKIKRNISTKGMLPLRKSIPYNMVGCLGT